MSPRTTEDDKTIDVPPDVATDPHAAESLVASEKEVAPLAAPDLHALCLELCSLAEGINSIDVHDQRTLAENMQRARARVSEIRTVLAAHLPPIVTA